MLLTGSQIVIECLKEQGVDTVFGYPGGTILNVYDELYKHSDEIHHILTSHEQGAAHAADGYARATGKVGVCLATSGPGATNLVTGIATAYMDSIPMVAITANVTLPMLGKDSFQELVFAGAAGYCDGNVANAANAGCSCDEPMTVVEMQAGQTVEITGVDAANPEEPPHGFIPGEEKHVEAEKDSEDNMRALYGDAALPEVPFLKQPVIREETYATREEAVKNQKRKDTLIARSEQNLVGVLANGEVTIVDTNKTMTQTSVIEKNHVDKNCENQKSSVEREVDGMSPAKRLREEIVDGMLAGVSPLFPTGLLSLTETERRADAAGTFARASSLGLTPEKVKALAIGFQPGDWKIAFEDQQDRVLIILKHK